MNLLNLRWVLCGISAVYGLAMAPTGTFAANLTGRQLVAGAVEKFDAVRFADVERAVADFYRGDSTAARAALVSAKEKHADLPPTDVSLALLHLSVNRRAEAEAALDKAAESDPNDPEPYLLEAEIALRDGRPLSSSIAFAYARQALDTYKVNPYRRRLMEIRLDAGLASLNEMRGDVEAAMVHLQAWLSVDPKNPVALGSLGRMHFRNADYTAARSAFVELEKADKDSPPADVAMGRLYTDKGMRQEATRSMEAAVVAHPQDPRTRLTVADWAFLSGQRELAKEHIEAVLKQDPNSLGANLLKARLARDAGEIDTAETLLNAAVLRAPADFVASNELARTLAGSKDLQKRKTGLEYATRNYRLVTNRATPVGREATVTLAWLLLVNDRADDAEHVLLTLPDGSTVSNENAYLAAQIYAKLKRRDSATQALRAALAGDVYFPGRVQAEKLLAELASTKM